MENIIKTVLCGILSGCVALHAWHIATPESWRFLSPESVERLSIPGNVSAFVLLALMSWFSKR